jgi:hypothetical protein
MLDPLSLTVAALIASNMLEGAADEAGRGAWHAVGRLAGTVRAQFSGDDAAERALAAVEEAPSDEVRVRALAASIQQRMESHETFRRTVEELVADARRDPRVAQFIHVDGDVERVVNIGHADNVSF